MCEAVLETLLYRINEPLLEHKEASLGAVNSPGVQKAAQSTGMLRPGHAQGLRTPRRLQPGPAGGAGVAVVAVVWCPCCGVVSALWCGVYGVVCGMWCPWCGVHSVVSVLWCPCCGVMSVLWCRKCGVPAVVSVVWCS